MVIYMLNEHVMLYITDVCLFFLLDKVTLGTVQPVQCKSGNVVSGG